MIALAFSRRRGHSARVPSSRPTTLAEAISRAIALYDPLKPWDVVSNYDEHNWDEEAERAAPAVALATNKKQIYNALVDQLRPLVGSPDENEWARTRINEAAEAVWRWLQSESRQ